MLKAKIILDRDFALARIDRRMFGSFVEHVGRAVYGGIFEPGHPSSGPDGMRGDVLALTKELGVSVVRYPGGNFVSGFNWEDSVGPREARPSRLSLAWSTIESNEVGLHEFAGWTRQAGCEIMYAVNLGTRGVEDARNIVEYANHPGGSRYSDMRRKNGAQRPFDIGLWCLGNEMDAPWQMGEKTPEAYGLLANEAAKVMKMVDPHIEVIACGSSSPLPQFGRWELGVLDHCYENVDYLSVHRYHLREEGMTTGEYLAQAGDLDTYIRQVIAICDAVGAKRRSRKTMMLSFDEWNVWYHSRNEEEKLRRARPWQKTLPLLEDVYTFEDALMVGSMFMALLRHADRIKIACLAQLVNVIAPIMTRDGGPAWRQTIFWPFYHLSRYGRGVVLQKCGICETCAAGRYGTIEALDVLPVMTDEGGVNLFIVNRAEEAVELSLDMRAFGEMYASKHIEMTATHLGDVNEETEPARVFPHFKAAPAGNTVKIEKLSWNVIQFMKREMQDADSKSSD